MDTKDDYRLSRLHTVEYLKRLSSKGHSGAVSLFLSPGKTIETVVSRTNMVSGALPRWLVAEAQSSKNGFCLIGGEDVSLLLPPFPVAEDAIYQGVETEPILSMLQVDYVIAIILVRLGSYAIGAIQGERLLASKVGTGLVHSRHRQGGSSSQRFRRRRENQIDEFLSRVCERMQQHIGDYLRRADYVVYGGARTTTELLRKECPLLRGLERRELPPLLDITDPRQAVLEAAVSRVWSSRIIEWKAAR
jgi:hypothetical protein